MTFVVTSEEGERAVTVRLEGEADLAALPSFRDHLSRALERQPGVLLVDFTAATFIDSSTIRALLDARTQAQDSGGSLRLVCREPRILDILGYAGVDRDLDTYATAEDALGAG